MWIPKKGHNQVIIVHVQIRSTGLCLYINLVSLGICFLICPKFYLNSWVFPGSPFLHTVWPPTAVTLGWLSNSATELSTCGYGSCGFCVETAWTIIHNFFFWKFDHCLYDFLRNVLKYDIMWSFNLFISNMETIGCPAGLLELYM